MKAHSLLERIRRPEFAAPRRAVSDDEVRASVLSNLRSMCATWLGSSRSCPDYGIVCVSDIVHSCPEALALVAKAIRHTIATYEPRLTNVVVRPLASGSVSDALTLRFDIGASLVNGGRHVPVKFHTVVDASRNVQVS
jgi:type VI secretion system protein